jgi:hypothetical protein
VSSPINVTYAVIALFLDFDLWFSHHIQLCLWHVPIAARTSILNHGSSLICMLWPLTIPPYLFLLHSMRTHTTHCKLSNLSPNSHLSKVPIHSTLFLNINLYSIAFVHKTVDITHFHFVYKFHLSRVVVDQ